MANTFTVASLIRKVRERTGLIGSNRCSDEEIQGYLAEAMPDYWDALDSSGLLYSEAPVTVTTTGASEYPLTGVRGIISVRYQLDAQTLMPVHEADPRETHRYAYQGAGWATHYQHINSRLRLLPTPPTGQSYVVTYLPEHPNLETIQPTATVELVVPQGLPFLVNAAAAMVWNKLGDFEERDASFQLAQAQLAKLEKSAQERTWSTNRRVVDVKRDAEQFWDPASMRWGRKP